MIFELDGEIVFFFYLLKRPAVWTIKFGDDWFVVFNTNLVDPVLVTVEFQVPGIALVTDGFNRIHDEIRVKSGKRMFVMSHAVSLMRRL